MSRMLSVVSCALAALVCMATSQDDMSLIQHTYLSNSGNELGLETTAAEMARVLQSGDTKAALDMVPTLIEQSSNAIPADPLAEIVTVGSTEDISRTAALQRGWAKIQEDAKHLTNGDPAQILHQAKTALIQTGAMEQMRQMALTRANATKSLSKGAVPLDSMMVGFRTSVAPWNNILKMFAMPLVKASFTLFTNFFGPQGTGARLCIGAQVAADSTYGVHTRSEFGGINVWVGPAKWDNVPGWSFGTSGGVDDIPVWDVSDFAWTWTLAKVPETVGFHWDVLLIDDETLHAGMLQTDSKVETEHIHRHGSTWLQHVWCSPHWENTPLVIPDVEYVTAKSAPQQAVSAAGKSEEYNPDSDAV